MTPSAATSQAANEDLWPVFAPCRRFDRLVPQPEPHWLPPASTNSFQSRERSRQSLSPIPAEGSGEAKAAHGCRRTPPQAWVPLGHLQESSKPGQSRLENRLDAFMEEKSPLKTIKHAKNPLVVVQCYLKPLHCYFLGVADARGHRLMRLPCSHPGSSGVDRQKGPWSVPLFLPTDHGLFPTGQRAVAVCDEERLLLNGKFSWEI